MMMQEDRENEDEYFEQQPPGPSKSQLKREAHALQQLGVELVALKPAQLNKLPLSEELHQAILAAQKMHQRGARKRQLQFIGRIMREIDAEPIKSALEALASGSAAGKRQQRDLQQLFDALLADEQNALAELLDTYPDLDRQHLRQLLRNTRREQQQQKSDKSTRALLDYLRDLIND